MRLEDTVVFLAQALKKPLPGTLAHELIFQNLTDRAIIPPSAKKSAVLLLWINHNSSSALCLIHRTTHGLHGDQLAFPGGKIEATDEDAESAARRETLEEIGLQNICILGSLTQIYIPVSDFVVYPFVGYCTDENPIMKLQPNEVHDILFWDWDDFINSPIVPQAVVVRESKMKVNGFVIDNKFLWGASAMMSAELQALCKEI